MAESGQQGSDRPQEKIGRYELLREIGRGGMAIVYVARQPDLDRQVALKELSRFHAGSAEYAHRFLRESRLAGSLNHPNIVTVHEYFEHNTTPYIAMEYVPRGSLRPYMKRLTLSQIGGVLEGVLAGLAHGEAAGIVHRDLKPENIMVTSDGRVKITDFGIARATQRAGTQYMTATGMTVGTPAYMAPEQAMAGEIGPWSDLYSVGVMTYELVVGHVPFHDTEAPMVILMRHVNERIPSAVEVRPDIDPNLSDWIDSLLVKDPDKRVRHAIDAWESLEEIIVGLLGPLWRRNARLLDDQRAVEQAVPLTPAPFESQPSIRTPTPGSSKAVPAEGGFVTFEPGQPLGQPSASAATPPAAAPMSAEAPAAAPEEPAPEAPHPETPAAETPAAETPAAEAPAAEAPAAEAPAAEAPPLTPSEPDLPAPTPPQTPAPSAPISAVGPAVLAGAGEQGTAQPESDFVTYDPSPTAPPHPSPPAPSSDAPPVETPPVETPPAMMPPVETPPAVTPPAVTPPAVTPPAVTPPVETPPAMMPPVETPPAVTPPAGLPPAEALPEAATEPEPEPAEVADAGKDVEVPAESMPIPVTEAPPEADREPDAELEHESADERSPEPAVAMSAPARQRGGHRRRAPFVALAAAAAIVGAAIGFLIAPSSSHTTTRPPAPLSRTASAGPLNISFPTDWQQSASVPPEAASLKLSSPVTLTPEGTGQRGALVLGSSSAVQPDLLPASFVTALGATPHGSLVALGPHTFQRYLKLVPQNTTTAVSVYALPTTKAGTAIAACMLPSSGSDAFNAACEHILSSLKIPGAQLPLTASPAYAAGLSAVVTNLDRVRASTGRQLANAQRPSGQAAAARSLAAAYQQAAASVQKLQPGPAGVSANAAIADSLQKQAAGYRALAAAATHNSARAYGTARRQIANADSALRASIAQLRDDGYTLG
jgi:protein kinase-like protein